MRAAHRARRRFGQHFLVDPSVVDGIVAAVDPRPGEALVEIGPGHGAITDALVARAGRITAIEIDRDLAARLRGRHGIDLVEADVLEVDFEALSAVRGGPLRVVGNLPYNISTPILFKLLDAAGVVVDQHVMLQKEVGDRIAAAPVGRAYGRLSVMLQARYDVESVLDVPPSAFDPPPQVDSVVLRMTPHRRFADIDRQLLGEVVTVAFSQRRKLLRHSLGRWLDTRGATVSFDLQRRAEEVPVLEWIGLTRALGEAAPKGPATPSRREGSEAGREQP